MTKNILIALFTVICIISVYFYFSNQLPPGIEPKGNEALIATIALTTAIVSFLADIVALITKILEMKQTKDKGKIKGGKRS